MSQLVFQHTASPFVINRRQSCMSERKMTTQRLVYQIGLSYTPPTIHSYELCSSTLIEVFQLLLFLLSSYQIAHKTCIYFSAKVVKI